MPNDFLIGAWGGTGIYIIQYYLSLERNHVNFGKINNYEEKTTATTIVVWKYSEVEAAHTTIIKLRMEIAELWYDNEENEKLINILEETKYFEELEAEMKQNTEAKY
ncbi:hypothetical protein ACJX0J_036843, partial [Zea mays]